MTEKHIVRLWDGQQRTVEAKSHDLAGEHDFVSFYDQPEGGNVVYTVDRDRVDEIIPFGEDGHAIIEEVVDEETTTLKCDE